MARIALPLLLSLSACASAPEQKTNNIAAKMTAAENAEMIAALANREHSPQPTHKIQLLGGLASAKVEGRVAPKPECRDEDGGRSCVVRLEVGELPIVEEPAIIFCTVTTSPISFGPIVKAAQGNSGLTETPQLSARQIGSGISVSFIADSTFETDSGPFPGTVKVAALYAKGYTAVCSDSFVGGRETFKRVVAGYFSSLRLAANPFFPEVFDVGYRSRSGDRVLGVRYEMIARRNDGEPGFVELATSFRLDTDGKTWSVTDWTHAITRDGGGAPELFSSSFYSDGEGPWVISAKPSEDGRFRVKSEVGSRSDAIELTPKAPLSSELWSALELQRVDAGKKKSFRYARPSLDDGDPSFHYVELSKLGPGVVGERVVQHGQLGKKGRRPGEVDELHLDERGVVVKEVATDSVYELIHSSGDLPAPLAKAVRRKRGRK